MSRSGKNQNSNLKSHIIRQKFKDAKWILKDKKTGEIIEYDYHKMSDMVQNGYISHRNKNYTDNIHKSEPQKIGGIAIRELNIAGGLIAETDKRMVVHIDYQQVLPNHDVIDCYDYKYQCKECGTLTDKIRGQGKEKEKELFCRECLWITECR